MCCGVRPSAETEEHELPSQTSTHRNRQRTTAKTNLKRQRRKDQPSTCGKHKHAQPFRDWHLVPSLRIKRASKTEHFKRASFRSLFPATTHQSLNKINFARFQEAFAQHRPPVRILELLLSLAEKRFLLPVRQVAHAKQLSDPFVQPNFQKQ